MGVLLEVQRREQRGHISLLLLLWPQGVAVAVRSLPGHEMGCQAEILLLPDTICGCLSKSITQASCVCRTAHPYRLRLARPARSPAYLSIALLMA